MPFLENGLRPDLIINPHAIPSRMTIGQIIESLLGIVCTSYGAFGDCTAFQVKGPNYSTYGPLLTKAGFNHTGNHVLYNGMTGEQVQANIYMGPTYYMRLKHMVKDKINYRARGPNTVLTRQPVQGRANDGGLRIGEMERDAVCAHGLANFLNESFLVRGDEYYIAVCNKTGAIAIYNEEKNLFLSPYSDGPILFHTNPDGTMNIKNLTKFGRSFSILRIPYSFKLLIQELQVLNIQMRIITDENVDQLLSMSYSNNINKLLNKDENMTSEQMVVMIKDYMTNLKRNIDVREDIQFNIPETPELPTPVEIKEEGDIVSGPSLLTNINKDQEYSPPYAPYSPAYSPENIRLSDENIIPTSPAYVPNISDTSTNGSNTNESNSIINNNNNNNDNINNLTKNNILEVSEDLNKKEQTEETQKSENDDNKKIINTNIENTENNDTSSGQIKKINL
jgi:hypothetical protein